MGKNNQPYSSPVGTQQTGLMSQKTSVFSGPLPHPEVLGQYEKILPGVADRIIKMAEKQLEHRIEIEKKVIDSNVKNSKNGLFCGLIIGVVTLISGTLIGIFGKNTASYILSGVIGGGGLVSLVTVFIYGKNETRKEREQRRKETFADKGNGN